uniref:Uncharacterized protein n=1 Tax=Arundo donax TaxID=35708 RepID=A0A0A9H9L7_ARUDO
MKGHWFPQSPKA